MSDKLRQLTDKIYAEGIEKAEAESSRLLEKAKAEAEQIRESAKADAERLRRNAQRDAEATRQQVGAEVALTARKAIGRLKADLKRLVAENALNEPLRKGLSDPATLREVLVALASAMQKDANGHWTVVLAPEQRKKVEEHLEAGKAEVLRQGFSLTDAEGQAYGFRLRPEGEHYTLAFDDQAFAEFLSPYLRLETRQLLGGDFLPEAPIGGRADADPNNGPSYPHPAG